MRRHLGRRRDARAPARARSASTDSRAERCIRCSGRLLVRGEREVARDHHALGDRRVAGEPELGRDGALVHVAAARQRRLLAVQRERPPGDRRVLERAPHQPGATTGRPSSVKPAAPASASSPISVSSLPAWPFVIAARKPDRDLAPRARAARRARRARRPSRRPARCSASRGSRSSRRPRPPRCPVAIVSSSSRPGVRRCTCGSTNAGASTSRRRRPRGGRSRRGRAELGDHAAVDRTSSARRCPRPGRARARRGRRGRGGRSWPTASRHLHGDLGRDRDRPGREQVVEHGHAHDEAGAHLRRRSARRPRRRRAGRSRRRGSSGPGA